MKKALRVLVPLLLIIAILASACWYFLVYDRDLTRDLLLSQARRLESSGSHKLAAILYDLTYDYSSNDEDIAIELAQKYKDAGNYTKAEYTLSRAIADGGGSKLYIALSKTFVEQDKLLDAVKMMDQITDPAISKELAALRPQTPTVDKAPDFYNQYISVQVSAPSGVLYVTTDGTYPSVSMEPCTQPIALSKGETTLYALAVGENGLVSPLGIFGYTIGGVVEEVTISDPAFNRTIRELLGADEEDAIFSDSLWEITEFTVPEDAEDYSDLALLPYLRSLSVTKAAEDQLTHVSGMMYLEELYVAESTPTEPELSAIASLPKLRKLTLYGCTLSTVSPLSSATELEYLDLTDNTIRNLAPLGGMVKLQELYLSHNAVTELTSLSSLSALKKLDVSFNSISSISPVCGIAGLTELRASNNLLDSLGQVDHLASLKVLDVSENAITDVSGLSGCTLLTELNISVNTITDISSLSGLTLLQTLNCSYNEITALPDFSGETPLVTIDASHNLLTDVEPLGKIQSMNYVYLDYNPELESLEPLKGCPLLIQVNVYGTLVTDVAFLTDQSIIVNYDPTL